MFINVLLLLYNVFIAFTGHDPYPSTRGDGGSTEKRRIVSMDQEIYERRTTTPVNKESISKSKH